VQGPGNTTSDTTRACASAHEATRNRWIAQRPTTHVNGSRYYIGTYMSYSTGKARNRLGRRYVVVACMFSGGGGT
jgi:hypothetical protein